MKDNYPSTKYPGIVVIKMKATRSLQERISKVLKKRQYLGLEYGLKADKATFITNGETYTVVTGDHISVRLELSLYTRGYVFFTNILQVSTGSQTIVGRPIILNSLVSGEIINCEKCSGGRKGATQEFKNNNTNSYTAFVKITNIYIYIA